MPLDVPLHAPAAQHLGDLQPPQRRAADVDGRHAPRGRLEGQGRRGYRHRGGAQFVGFAVPDLESGDAGSGVLFSEGLLSAGLESAGLASPPFEGGAMPSTLMSKTSVLPASGWLRSTTTVFSLISFTTTGRPSPAALRAMSWAPTTSASGGTALFATSVCAVGSTGPKASSGLSTTFFSWPGRKPASCFSSPGRI